MNSSVWAISPPPRQEVKLLGPLNTSIKPLQVMGGARPPLAILLKYNYSR